MKTIYYQIGNERMITVELDDNTFNQWVKNDSVLIEDIRYIQKPIKIYKDYAKFLLVRHKDNITELFTKESLESFDEVVDRLRGLPTTPEGWHDIDNCNSTLGTIKSITFVDQSNKDYLQMKLARHIELEEYELAAIVRDKINAL